MVPGLKFSLTTSAVAIRRSADLAPLRLLQVERDAFLVAVEQRKEARARSQQPARVVARDRFDLDHLGAQVGQHHAAGRAHHHVGELDDAYARAASAEAPRRGCEVSMRAFSPVRAGTIPKRAIRP